MGIYLYDTYLRYMIFCCWFCLYLFSCLYPYRVQVRNPGHTSQPSGLPVQDNDSVGAVCLFCFAVCFVLLRLFVFVCLIFFVVCLFFAGFCLFVFVCFLFIIYLFIHSFIHTFIDSLIIN